MLTVRSAPRHEALLVRRQRADPRRQTIRGHQQCVTAKQCRDLLLVGLKLIESACQGGALSPGGFELNNGHRSEEHTSELQSRGHLVCRLLLEKKKKYLITS